MSNVNYELKRKEENFSPIRTIMLLNQRVKEITLYANRVYLTALNAMFMARRVSSKTMAYTRVTTELRKFSHQMDESMSELSDKISNMVFKSAECRKNLQRRVKMTHALSLTNNATSRRILELRQYYQQNNENDRSAFSKVSQVIINHMNRLNDLIRIGQNLVVLSKVEAMQADGYTEVLADISERIESSLEKIEDICKEMKASVA